MAVALPIESGCRPWAVTPLRSPRRVAWAMASRPRAHFFGGVAMRERGKPRKKGDRWYQKPGTRRETGAGYIQVMCPDGFWYMEHVLAWEAEYGPKPSGWYVHHVNGNKKDNRLENLDLVAASCHKRLHWGWSFTPGVGWSKRCHKCGRFLPQESFSRRGAVGLQQRCKDCDQMSRKINHLRALARAAALAGVTVLCGWQPNVQVIGTCGDVPSICAESDSLGIVAVETPDCPGHTIVWQTTGTGVPDAVEAQGCKVEAR